jgi:hypothetical protein
MSYTIGIANILYPTELFLVTFHCGENDDFQSIFSKKGIQSKLKSPLGKFITEIRRIQINTTEEVSKKYFLPKNWEKISKQSRSYYIWKEIAEEEE